MKQLDCSEVMAEVRLLTQIAPGTLKRVRELYIEAGWLNGDDDAAFLLPALQNSCCTAGAFDENGELVGIGRALSDGCSDAYIQDVVVTARCRKQGIGGAIIRCLVRDLRQKGVDWIALVGEPGTENFYGGLGLKRQDGYVLWKIPGDFAEN